MKARLDSTVTSMVNEPKARIYHTDGRVQHWDDQSLAYAVWLALPNGVRVAFRRKNDDRPVYPWDCVDAR